MLPHEPSARRETPPLPRRPDPDPLLINGSKLLLTLKIKILRLVHYIY